MSKLIDGKKFADSLCNKISKEVSKLKEKNVTPGLAVIRVGEDPASTVYINMKAKKTKEVGMHSVTKILDEKISQSDLLNIVEELNIDESINGISITWPHNACHTEIEKFLTKCSSFLLKFLDSMRPVFRL